MNITIITGSPRLESISRRIGLHLIQKLSEENAVQVNMIDISEIPALTLTTTWNAIEKVPTALHEKWHIMKDTDAFIFVSPEYNGSYSPSMKNWIDHFPKGFYYRKTIGIVTGSTGAMGGLRATQQMQLLACALFGIPCPFMLVVPFMDKKIDELGNLIDANFETNVNTFAAEFLWQSRQISGV